MPIAKHLVGFSSVSDRALPPRSGVFLISCEVSNEHSPLYAAFADNIVEAALQAMRTFRLEAECSGVLRYEVFETTDTKMGVAKAQALSPHCKYK